MIALTRVVPPSIAACELTHLERSPIDHARAADQHRLYEEALAELGCGIERVTAAPHLPDSVFVEDAAVVLPELAIVARPGAESRRPEIRHVEASLRRHRRTVARILPPGTLEGGDVLRVGRRIFVGLSRRSNAEGIRQLRKIAAPLGYPVHAVPISESLHLKTAVTAVAEGTLLINRDWVDEGAFDGYELIDVDPREPFAANALLVGATVVYAEAHARTRDRLDRRGIRVRTVPADELARAEAGVTCCSIVFEAESGR